MMVSDYDGNEGSELTNILNTVPDNMSAVYTDAWHQEFVKILVSS